MSNPALYPLKLKPSLHIKVWGGRKLSTDMNKALPTDDPYGEAWELHDTSTITNGVLKGKTLGDLVQSHGIDLIGDGNNPDEGFPLLAKILDASDWLSVQVHPNDKQAKELEDDPRGKTEAWVVLVADNGAQLVIGVKSGTSREVMAQAIRDNQLEDYIVYANVKVGDVLYIPANTVHALGPGLLIYEIQQSSNITYRLYDWGRMGLDGNPRDLHIKKGVQVSNLDSLPNITHPTDDLIVDGEYFQTLRHTLDNTKLALSTNGCFQSLTCINGEIIIHSDGHEDVTLSKGQTGLIPACIDDFTIDGAGTVLRSFQK
jgi:mannose-6-phosphate isomerase